MSKLFYDAVRERRSVYAIDPNIKVPFETIEKVVEMAVLHAPSAFNSQSGRVVLLSNQSHEALWDITMEALRKIVPADAFPQTEAKIKSFAAGFGTLLFFEDQAVVQSLQDQFALYKDNFPVWSQQSSGMLQYLVWTGLHQEGLGSSLQHYNELIEDAVKAKWSLPNEWRLIAQMPFGNPVANPGEKTFAPVADRVKVFR